jgi:hypothetical protein
MGNVFHCIGWLRGFIADYGVPLMVLVWTGVSYMPYGSVPKGIPRRLFSPNPWSPGAYDNWTVVKACNKHLLFSNSNIKNIIVVHADISSLSG